MEKLILGYIPTRRTIFSVPDAIKFNKLIREKLEEYTDRIEIVGIEDINEEGLIVDNIRDVEAIIQKMKVNKVDAIFIPHCNFGTEDSVARIAREVGKPTLLWGPRDEAPLPDGQRLRDTQCGMFATGKVLRRFGVKFTYITNSTLDSEVFARGFDNFIRAANVVKHFKKTRILQIDTRPAGFWSVICNEGELLEKFGIETHPISLTELEMKTKALEAENSDELKATVADIKKKINCQGVEEKYIIRVAAMKLAMKSFADEYQCNCAAIQCWNAMQDCMDIMPCLANGLLTEEGFPVACETDICGAVSSVMAQAATFGQKPAFFADITVRDWDNENGELLFHCGNFPPSLMTDGKFRTHFTFPSQSQGTGEGEIKGGDISIIRFDGDHGEYSLLMGKAKGYHGRFSRGSFLWVEVNDWPLWEEKVITGPYIHHAIGIHEYIVPVMYEACKYLGITPDPVDPEEKEIQAWLRGSK